MSDSLFLDVCAGKKVPEKPVWLMRQAGRYLPEYRKIRERFSSFLDFVADSDAAAEVTLQPVERFHLDAAILFSDILVTLPPMGFQLSFESGKGPVIQNPVRNIQDLEQIKNPDLEKALSYTREAIQKTKKRLPGSVPLLGFAGGPLTVASYAIEGKSAPQLLETKKLLFTKPEIFDGFMQIITEFTGNYLLLQAEWGCDALVIMDSWAGHFGKETYRDFILPYTRQIADKIKSVTDMPIIHYANGASHLLSCVKSLSVNVIGLDWRTDISEAFEKYPQQIFQGNPDPSFLFAEPQTVRRQTEILLEKVQDRPHIFNLGHGVLPGTPVENVQVFIDTIRGKH
ncbi:MAG: uroporphyrinogen decarboxylase [Fibrobacter sp.]|jgi:uroporphyrinogen decarboxylase|nr:uroporphyrinogen decarboxylase [Fibrobacter sp.]